MKTPAVSRELLANIALPEPQLTKLNFCSSNRVSKVADWVDALHATQIAKTSAVLYKALPEIHQLKVSPDIRLSMLEALRPTTQNIIQGLTLDALQNVNMPLSEVQKISIVALSLQKNMLDGYTRCAYEFCQSKKLSASIATQLSLAIHRSITGIGLLFLRRYQLYTQPPSGLWLRLHSLFQIAEHFDFLAKPVADPLLVHMKAINTQCAYVRVLMMPAAKLNQLSKNDVQTLYDKFEEWSSSVKLLNANPHSIENLYAVNVDSDQAPAYKNRLSNEIPGRVIEISFHNLVAHLSAWQQETNTIDNAVNTDKLTPNIAPAIVNHVIECWSGIAERHQERKNVQSSADICIGLVDCHRMIGGGLSFEEFNRMGGLRAAESRLSMFPNDLSADKPSAKTQDVNTYRVTMKNQSSGGYCLEWKGDAPIRLEAGEFIGIKNIGKRTWTLSVVRWIKQLKRGTVLGVQLLSKSPIAAGAAQEYDMGGHSDYMRVFLCTSSEADQALSIITPVKPFKEHERLKLYDGDGVYSIQLNQCLFATSIVKQFSYTPNDANATATPGKAQTTKTRDKFDNSWD